MSAAARGASEGGASRAVPIAQQRGSAVFAQSPPLRPHLSVRALCRRIITSGVVDAPRALLGRQTAVGAVGDGRHADETKAEGDASGRLPPTRGGGRPRLQRAEAPPPHAASRAQRAEGPGVGRRARVLLIADCSHSRGQASRLRTTCALRCSLRRAFFWIRWLLTMGERRSTATRLCSAANNDASF